ncbi:MULTISPECIES: glycosyltransferase [Streptomycetaceae]|uniref:glycosyltransferase n=1 Tax=Streptomycetaceae TaxID=2062 RepID=UPI00093A8E65|nr:glycosyltransferase [Streptomyces sp. CB02056]OKI03709.1 UDP-glucose:sterol glucosyltransferase [Streptomyces sp. CB02056]
MRILIATAGSRGDVAPFTGLGVRLRAAGHQVAVATHDTFAESVRAAGLEFRPLPVDPRAELASVEGRRLLRAGSGPGAVLQLLRLGRRFMPALGDGIADATALGTDLLLTTSTTSALGQVAAEAAGIPSIGLYLQPLAPTREFAPAVTGTRSLGRSGNLLAGHAVQAATDQLFVPAVRGLRRRLGLPPLGIARARRNHPVLHGFSPLVVPRPADWRPRLEVAGYWWPADRPDWQPPARLLDFLTAGPPPVFVGFGSLVVPDAERLTATVLAAARAARVRLLLQSGWSGLAAEDSDSVLTVGDTPHDWLFPRTAAVVHHAGAGTTAATLRSGTPAVPVPAQLDAPFWSARLARLGVSPGPVPLRGLTPARLATSLRLTLDDPRYRTRARAVATALAAEDGAAKVLAAVERVSANS